MQGNDEDRGRCHIAVTLSCIQIGTVWRHREWLGTRATFRRIIDRTRIWRRCGRISTGMDAVFFEYCASGLLSGLGGDSGGVSEICVCSSWSATRAQNTALEPVLTLSAELPLTPRLPLALPIVPLPLTPPFEPPPFALTTGIILGNSSRKSRI